MRNEFLTSPNRPADRSSDGSNAQHYVERVYREIKAMAISYELRPDEQINIHLLAQKLHVSATPVREALNRLLNEDLLVRRNSRGFFNRAIDIAELKELMQLWGSLVIGTLFFLLEKIAEEPVRRAITDWLERARLDGQPDAAASTRGELLDLLASLCGNREIGRQAERIRERLSFVCRISLAAPEARAVHHAFERGLAESILKTDSDACVRLVKENTQTRSAALNEVLKEGLAQLYIDAGPNSRLSMGTGRTNSAM
jgi:DNA-binding GntR family transcriptional regulator